MGEESAEERGEWRELREKYEKERRVRTARVRKERWRVQNGKEDDDKEATRGGFPADIAVVVKLR